MKYPILEFLKLKYEPENVLKIKTAAGFFSNHQKNEHKKIYICI